PFPVRAAALREGYSRGAARLLAEVSGTGPCRAAIQQAGGRSASDGELADLKPVRWEENRAIPRCVAALLAGHAPDRATGAEWKAALHYFDRNQLTLMLPRAGLPDSIQRRLQKNSADNRERVRRLKQAFLEIDEAIKTPFLVLKGFANWDQFTTDPLSRVQ